MQLMQLLIVTEGKCRDQEERNNGLEPFVHHYRVALIVMSDILLIRKTI